MPRHSDFQKIYDAFMWRYCDNHLECDTGKSYYYAWLNKMGLDDSKAYQRPQEKFSWTVPYLQFLREDGQAKYFKVEALFPLTSMNNNVYTEDELTRGARSLVGKTVNWNHTKDIALGVSIFDADYEDDCVESILRVQKDSKALDLIEKGEVIHVSIEADCLRGSELTPEGWTCKGLVFTGLALLTKEELPGVPLTRIMPVEKLVESFTVEEVNKMENDKEKGKDPKTENKDQQPGQNVVVPQKNPEVAEYNKSPEDTAWDFDGSKYDIDQLRFACAVVTGPSGEDGKYVKEDCHLPHHLPGDGKTHGGTLVWRGVAAAGAVLMGGRGGVKISAEDQAKAKTHLEKHYGEFEKKAPWQEESSGIKALHEQVMYKCPKCGSVFSYYEWQGNNWHCRNPDCNIEVEPPEPIVLSPRQASFAISVETIPQLEAKVKGLTEQLEEMKKPKPEPQPVANQGPKEPCKCVLTKEGFWARFHELRGQGFSKSEAFRVVSLEVIEASQKKSS